MDEEEIEGRLLQRAVMRYAMARFESLAIGVVREVQMYPASVGLEGDGRGKTLWNNYCFDQDRGPTPILESVWSETFKPHLISAVDGLDQAEATLLTFFCCWDQCADPIEIVGDPPVGVYPEALTAAIMAEVARLARDRKWCGDDEGPYCDEEEGS